LTNRFIGGHIDGEQNQSINMAASLDRKKHTC
jgi:hypothetical protein